MNHVPAFSFTYARSSVGLSCATPLPYADGQIIWLVGASGSGKSTFLNLLKGFYPEFLAGELTGELPAVFNQAMYLSQNPLSQIVHERVGEEFFLTMENADASVAHMHAQRFWLSRFGLNEREFDKTATLSHGLSQRLLLASLLSSQPEWLLFDEPTAFLNPAMRDGLYDTLRELKGEVGMVIIDHHDHMASLADICWHVDAAGQITAISVDEWLRRQAASVAFERAHPRSLALPNLSEKIQLNAQNLTIGYAKNALFTANFTLSSGECAVLTGRNGAGKSTLFNTLAAVQKPISGGFTLRVNDAVIKKPRTQMAYVFQHPDSHFYFDSIADELTQLNVEDIESSLQKINLENTAERSPHQLSEGQKRRLTLLYPQLQSRPLILLDEPTFGQDAVNVERVITLIQSLKAAGHALIVISHDPALTAAVATQHWHIEHGSFTVSPV